MPADTSARKERARGWLMTDIVTGISIYRLDPTSSETPTMERACTRVAARRFLRATWASWSCTGLTFSAIEQARTANPAGKPLSEFQTFR